MTATAIDYSELNKDVRVQWPFDFKKKKSIKESIPVMWDYVKRKVVPVFKSWKADEYLLQGKLVTVLLRQYDADFIPTLEDFHMKVKLPNGIEDTVKEFYNEFADKFFQDATKCFENFMYQFRFNLYDYGCRLFYGSRYEEEAMIQNSFCALNPLSVILLNRLTLSIDPSSIVDRVSRIQDLLLPADPVKRRRYKKNYGMDKLNWVSASDAFVTKLIEDTVHDVLKNNWDHKANVDIEAEVPRFTGFEMKENPMLSDEQKELIQKKINRDRGFRVFFDVVNDEQNPGFTNVTLRNSLRQLDIVLRLYFQGAGECLNTLFPVLLEGKPYVIKVSEWEELENGELKDATSFAKLFCYFMFQHCRLDLGTGGTMKDLCMKVCNTIMGKQDEYLAKRLAKIREDMKTVEIAFEDELYQYEFVKPTNITYPKNPRSENAPAAQLRLEMIKSAYRMLMFQERIILGASGNANEFAQTLDRMQLIKLKEFKKKKREENEPDIILTKEAKEHSAKVRFEAIGKICMPYMDDLLKHLFEKDCEMYLSKLEKRSA